MDRVRVCCGSEHHYLRIVVTVSRVAAIDCGTNSIRLLITDIEGQHKRDLVREMRIVRLGQGVDAEGRLSAEAIERTVHACTDYAHMIDAWAVDQVTFAATSATRDAENADDFSEAVYAVLGVRPRVLTGEEEARASFAGATGELAEGLTLVCDIGGGSTELVQGVGTPTIAHSLNIGSVRMSERFLSTDPPTITQIGDCIEWLDQVLEPELAQFDTSSTVIMVAGTATTIAAHTLGLESYDSERIHGARLDIDEMRAACTSLVSMTVADRRLLPYMHPGRADVIGGGALVVDRLLEHLRVETTQIRISERDILDGIALAAAGMA